MIFANSLLKKPKNLGFKYWKTNLLEELEEMMFGKIRKGRAPRTPEEEEFKEEEEGEKELLEDENNDDVDENNDDDDDDEENDNEEEENDDEQENNDDKENDDDQENDDNQENPDNDDEENHDDQENAGAEGQNVEEPSPKTKWTRSLISNRLTPEKKDLQMTVGMILLNVHQMYFLHVLCVFWTIESLHLVSKFRN